MDWETEAGNAVVDTIHYLRGANFAVQESPYAVPARYSLTEYSHDPMQDLPSDFWFHVVGRFETLADAKAEAERRHNEAG